MATFKEFLKTGALGPIHLGMVPFEAETVLGQPQGRSRKMNPLGLKYGSLRLTFWKHQGALRSQLMEIVLQFQPVIEEIPDVVKLTDISLTRETTESQVRAFLHEIGYLPSHMVQGEQLRHLSFLSGVSISFEDGMLHSVRHSQRQSRDDTPSPLSDEREPSTTQISEMLDEAQMVMRNGSPRSALVLAWAAVEAVLRRVAIRAGQQGRIGVQPAILIRELNSARLIDEDAVTLLESARQIRTAVAHGLAPQPIDETMVSRLIHLASRLVGNIGG